MVMTTLSSTSRQDMSSARWQDEQHDDIIFYIYNNVDGTGNQHIDAVSTTMSMAPMLTACCRSGIKKGEQGVTL